MNHFSIVQRNISHHVPKLIFIISCLYLCHLFCCLLRKTCTLHGITQVETKPSCFTLIIEICLFVCVDATQNNVNHTLLKKTISRKKFIPRENIKTRTITEKTMDKRTSGIGCKYVRAGLYSNDYIVNTQNKSWSPTHNSFLYCKYSREKQYLLIYRPISENILISAYRTLEARGRCVSWLGNGRKFRTKTTLKKRTSGLLRSLTKIRCCHLT